MEQDSSLVPIFADDGDTVQTGAGSQVSGHGKSLQKSDAVAFHFKGSYMSNFSQHGKFEVKEIDGDHRIFQQFFVDQSFLDLFG